MKKKGYSHSEKKHEAIESEFEMREGKRNIFQRNK
jgi:hypothetical protein